ncbi:MAG TPA: hypothetical protein PLQ49_04865 [Methanothrix sp.]|nr:hypothetical protein [Methanothrix sp.]
MKREKNARRRFRGAESAASSSLGSSPWRAPSGRSRPAPRPAPTGRAETSVVLADERRRPACRAFGAAGVY